MGETEQGWVDQAQYDLETARAMLTSRRFLYVLFCCQQAVEKALKAVIVRRTGEMPPRVHNLLRLVEVAQVQPDQEQMRLLGELSAYYIQSRYPEEIKAAGATITRDIADEAMKKTEKILPWVLSMTK